MREPSFKLRLYILTAVILLGCGTLLSRLYSFQIEEQERFLNQMPGTTTISVREPGVRGEILDRNGVPLAENLRNYEISFNLEEVHDAYRQALRESKGEVDSKSRINSISDIVNATVIPELEKLGLAKNYSARALDVHYLTYKGHVPYIYRDDLTFEQFAVFAENTSNLPGVYVATAPQRRYPYGSLASHILGYTEQWDKADIPTEAKEKYNFYTGDTKGIAGIEATQNEFLTGPEGAQTMLRDEKGNIVALVDSLNPGQGATVELTIDARVQALTETVLRRVGRGAAVVMDVNTGEILAMASVPDYDPNDFIPSISGEAYKNYRENRARPFTNRAISAFAPGSTFKLPTTLASFRSGRGAPNHVCSGGVNYGNSRIRCWIERQFSGRHGALNVEKAIQVSCNPYFNIMANRIGSDALVESFEMFGFGSETGIPLPLEASGVVIGSRYWQRKTSPPRTMTPARQAFLSIGQGEAEATPLQINNMVCAIANGGTFYQPRLIKRITHPDRGLLVEDRPIVRVNLLEEGVKESDIKRIQQGMWQAVNGTGTSTARRAGLPDIEVAGKTGTAQASLFMSKNNSWTVAYAPYESPRYAVTVLVESGGSGGKVAGPLARLILKGLFAQENGNRLPLRRMTPYYGNLERYEEVVVEDDDPLVLALDDIDDSADPEAVSPGTLSTEGPGDGSDLLPTPTITPEVDDGGSVLTEE